MKKATLAFSRAAFSAGRHFQSLSCGLLLSCAALAQAAVGDSWSLPGAGTQDFISLGPWQGEFGTTNNNPYEQAGSVSGTPAQWAAVYQGTPGAALSDSYSKMYFANRFAYDGIHVFSGDPAGTSAFDPYPVYHGHNLTATNSPGAGSGPSSGVFFLAPESGTYHVDVQAALTGFGANTAGFGHVEIFTLSGSFTGDTFNVTSSTLLQGFDLNTAGGFGGFPDSFSYSSDLVLGAGDVLGVRFTSVAPGPAPAGPGSLDFGPGSGGVFTITQVVPEPQAWLLIIAGGLGVMLFHRSRTRPASNCQA